MDEIEYEYEASAIDEDTVLVTAAFDEKVLNKEREIILAGIDMYSEKRNEQYSVIPADSTSTQELTLTKVNELAIGLNSNLNNLLTANELILQSVISDGYMGRSYECIFSNVNTDYKLTWDQVFENSNTKQLDQIKEAIADFNQMVDMNELIRASTSGTFLEGNFPMYLRIKGDKPEDIIATVDHYPLSVCYPSDYKINGETILEFDITKLKERLRKTYQKSKKTKKAIYFEKIEKEVQANYPPEIYKAYKDGETYARLDIQYSACPKINSMNRKFGISPFFKCLKPLIVLNNIENADVSSSKSRAKKIIFQKLRKELMGNNGERKGFLEQAHAHQQAAEAIKTSFCLYTAPAFVESLEYVTDETNNKDTSETIKTYTSKLLTALGISFADSDLSSFSTATISVEQLMRTINSITKQIEDSIYKFYQAYLKALNLDATLAPKISIIDSEMMEWDLRQNFAKFAYGTLNVSRETAFKLIGLDVEDEKQKRQRENEEGYDEVFAPRITAYNASSDGVSLRKEIVGGDEPSAGRKATSENKEQQALDTEYTKVNR